MGSTSDDMPRKTFIILILYNFLCCLLEYLMIWGFKYTG